jgi:hypothetical protein
MCMPKLLDDNSPLLLTLAFLPLLILLACNVNVRKNGEGQDKRVDIETPIGGLHVSKNADVRDVGLPVYPGARRKEKNEDGEENSASVNLSSNLFGFRVVAIEYLSEDPPERLIAYYKNQLKKYGSVLECHTDKSHAGANINPGEDHSGDSKQWKCDGNKHGTTIELKVGTEPSQHIVSISPGDTGKGSDFGLVYIQLRSGKDTI